MRKIPAALLSLALTASLTAPLASAAGTGRPLEPVRLRALARLRHCRG